MHSKYHKNPRREIEEALLLDSLEEFVFQGPDLIQDVDDLATGVWHPQDLVLPEVSMDGKDDDVEDRRHPAEEPGHVGGVRCLQHLGEVGDGLSARLGGGAPASVQPPLLKPVLKPLVRRGAVQAGEEGLGEEQRRL